MVVKNLTLRLCHGGENLTLSLAHVVDKSYTETCLWC